VARDLSWGSDSVVPLATRWTSAVLTPAPLVVELGRSPLCCCLSRTSEARTVVTTPLQRCLTWEPREVVRVTACNSPGVSCLYSTFVDRKSGSRKLPASPPPGFRYPPGSYFPCDPTRRNGSASEVNPSEDFPFTVCFSVSEAQPSCRWSLGTLRLQGLARRRSVGAEAPRSSPGIPSSRACTPAAHRDALSSRGPSMRFPGPLPERGRPPALRGIFCCGTRFPLSR